MSSFDPTTLIAKKKFISDLFTSKNAVPVGEGRTHCSICGGEFGTTSDTTSKSERQIRLPCELCGGVSGTTPATTSKSERQVRLPCNHSHTFGSDCIVEWLQRRNTCPECRHEFFSAEVNEIDDDSDDDEDDDEDHTQHEEEAEERIGAANEGRREGNGGDGPKCTCRWRQDKRSRMIDLLEDDEEWEQDWMSPKETGDEDDDGTAAEQEMKISPGTAGVPNDHESEEAKAGPLGAEAAGGLDVNNHDEQEPDGEMGVVGLEVSDDDMDGGRGIYTDGPFQLRDS